MTFPSSFVHRYDDCLTVVLCPLSPCPSPRANSSPQSRAHIATFCTWDTIHLALPDRIFRVRSGLVLRAYCIWCTSSFCPPYASIYIPIRSLLRRFLLALPFMSIPYVAFLGSCVSMNASILCWCLPCLDSFVVYMSIFHSGVSMECYLFYSTLVMNLGKLYVDRKCVPPYTLRNIIICELLFSLSLRMSSEEPRSVRIEI